MTLPRGSVFRNEASWCGVTNTHEAQKACLLRQHHILNFKKKSTFLFIYLHRQFLVAGRRTRSSWMINFTICVALWRVSKANVWEFTLKMYILCSTTGRANPSVFAMLWIKTQRWEGAGYFCRLLFCGFHRIRPTAHLNSAWMCNPFVQRFIRMQGWKNKNCGNEMSTWPVWKRARKLPWATLFSARCFGMMNSPGKHVEIHISFHKEVITAFYRAHRCCQKLLFQRRSESCLHWS